MWGRGRPAETSAVGSVAVTTKSPHARASWEPKRQPYWLTGAAGAGGVAGAAAASGAGVVVEAGAGAGVESGAGAVAGVGVALAVSWSSFTASVFATCLVL